VRLKVCASRGWLAAGIAGILPGIVFALGFPAWALDAPQARATLKGITAIKVVVESLGPDVEKDGLTSEQVRAEVEQRLGQAGITVDPSAAEYLYVKISTVKPPSGFYAYSLHIEFRQPVSLLRDSSVVAYAITWDAGRIGTVGAANLRNLRNSVAGTVDEFITAYREQNPKQ
jgi:hypothetical protein